MAEVKENKCKYIKIEDYVIKEKYKTMSLNRTKSRKLLNNITRKDMLIENFKQISYFILSMFMLVALIGTITVVDSGINKLFLIIPPFLFIIGFISGCRGLMLRMSYNKSDEYFDYKYAAKNNKLKTEYASEDTIITEDFIFFNKKNDTINDKIAEFNDLIKTNDDVKELVKIWFESKKNLDDNTVKYSLEDHLIVEEKIKDIFDSSDYYGEDAKEEEIKLLEIENNKNDYLRDELLENIRLSNASIKKELNNI